MSKPIDIENMHIEMICPECGNEVEIWLDSLDEKIDGGYGQKCLCGNYLSVAVKAEAFSQGRPNERTTQESKP